jgi:type VI secretion system secreted protein VgrG
MANTQVYRHFAFASPLGDDVLVLNQINGREGISQLFQFDLDLLSNDPAIDFDAIIGKNVTVRLRQADGTDRFFNGIVSRFTQAGTATSGTEADIMTAYHAEMVPWLWLLTRTADCKIFQLATAPDIIMQVFGTYGFGNVRNNLQGTYPVLEYCVQYRETDFNFVSRLMEQYGIFYYFEHTNGAHTLVLADSNGAFVPCPSQSRFRFQITQGATKGDEDVVAHLVKRQDVASTKYSLMDFNFETPGVNLQVNIDSTLPPPAGMQFELYDYPGEYLVRDVGEILARVRVEEEHSGSIAVEGMSNCRPFVSGYTFDLTEHPRGDVNQSYVLTAVQHTGTEGTHTSGDPGGGFRYENRFTCIPVSVPFRAERLTPKPVINGLQTAIVAGVPGEEIYVDIYGRIKVQFHWDRFGQRDENSSCWIRVAQNWAGKRWGAVFLPRIGQEVLVGFLEGDPDQPLVVGCVYNGDQMQPYALPDHQTRSVLRTDRTMGGGECNEVRFEDKVGFEEIFVHGMGELNIHVVTDRHETIEGERHLQVYKDKIEEVKQNRFSQIKLDEVIDAGQDMSHKIGGNLIQDVGVSHCEQAGQEIYLKAGMKVVVEAGVEVTLKAAGSFVKVDPSGVTIQGPLVLINSGGAAGAGTTQRAKSLPAVVEVEPPDAGSPDFNIFVPTNVADPSDASGSCPAVPSEEDEA